MKAIELANQLDAEQNYKFAQWQTDESKHPAATELRRLADMNAELLGALDDLLSIADLAGAPNGAWAEERDKARAVSAKAKEQQ